MEEWYSRLASSRPVSGEEGLGSQNNETPLTNWCLLHVVSLRTFLIIILNALNASSCVQVTLDYFRWARQASLTQID